MAINSLMSIDTTNFPHFLKHTIDYRTYLDSNVGVLDFLKERSRIILETEYNEAFLNQVPSTRNVSTEEIIPASLILFFNKGRVGVVKSSWVR